VCELNEYCIKYKREGGGFGQENPHRPIWINVALVLREGPEMQAGYILGPMSFVAKEVPGKGLGRKKKSGEKR